MRRIIHRLCIWIGPAIVGTALTIIATVSAVAQGFPKTVSVFSVWYRKALPIMTGVWFIVGCVAAVTTWLFLLFWSMERDSGKSGQSALNPNYVAITAALDHLARNTHWGRQSAMLDDGWSYWFARSGAGWELKKNGLLGGSVRAIGRSVDGGPLRPIQAQEWATLDIAPLTPEDHVQSTTFPPALSGLQVSWPDLIGQWPSASRLTKARWRIVEFIASKVR